MRVRLRGLALLLLAIVASAAIGTADGAVSKSKPDYTVTKVTGLFDGAKRSLGVVAAVANSGARPRAGTRLKAILEGARGASVATASVALPRLGRNGHKSVRLALAIPASALGSTNTLKVCATLPRGVRDAKPKDNCRSKAGIVIPRPAMDAIPTTPATDPAPPVDQQPVPTDPLPLNPDTTPPDTRITGGPSSPTTATNATFTYDATPSTDVDHFECRLGTDPFVTCPTNGMSYDALADGAYTFEVRAVDAAGNADDVPASQSWSVDTTPPDTQIDSGPPATSVSPMADFTFSANEGSTFECSLNGAAFMSCTSPVTVTTTQGVLSQFRVKATDALAHTDPSPAAYTWVSQNDAGSQITPLRSQADGPLSVPLTRLLVTYLKPAVGTEAAGFFVQQGTAPPSTAIYVAIDPATLSPAPQVGDQLSFTATSLGTVNGMREILSLADYSLDASGEVVGGIAQNVSPQDFTSVTTLNNYEAEFIFLDATTAGAFTATGDYVQAPITTQGVSSPSASFQFRTSGALVSGAGLSPGCSLGIGPSPLWRTNNTAQPTAWRSSDFGVRTCA